MVNRKVDSLVVKQFGNRVEMGKAAARDVTGKLLDLLAVQSTVNVVFAAAPSQNEFLEALVSGGDVDWTRVNAFHMDEYIGLPSNASQRFGKFLENRLFSKLHFRSVNYLDGNATHIADECQRYAHLLQEHPIDIVCMGIGENCHIAFNDPHVADFADLMWVKMVDLDSTCRQQQVNDGCFDTLLDVPTHALTLTIPALMAADYIFCMVPGLNKADAVHHTLLGNITPLYPSTILRLHRDAVLYTDEASASKL
ncbi:glucosamine-6-phosphate deaminase [Parapedobacter sp.]